MKHSEFDAVQNQLFAAIVILDSSAVLASIRAGAQLDCIDFEGWSALHYAIDREADETAQNWNNPVSSGRPPSGDLPELLIKEGASVNQICFNMTPLDLAEKVRHRSAMQLLRRSGGLKLSELRQA